MKRREFIKTSMVGIGSLVLGCNSIDSVQPTVACHNPYEMITLGKTGIKVSRVGLGTGMNGFNLTSNQVKLGQEKFHSLIQGCFERGIRWFDMADIYGSHPYIIPALKQIPRQDYVLVSKMWFRKNGLPWPQRPDADILIQRFLKEMNTDYIDIVLLHCMTEENWPEKHEKQMNILDGLKRKGIIRAHGVSCHSLPALRTASREPWVDSVHARINPYGAHMDGSPEQVIPVLRQFCTNGKGVIGMKIMGAGKFRNSEEQKNHSINFAMNIGCVDAVTVGFESLQEADDFANRVYKTHAVRISDYKIY